MSFKATKVDVWCGEIADEPGGLASKLEPLACAGVDLDFVIARRQPDKPGKGVLFVTGIKGAKQKKAAEAAGLCKTTEMAALRIEGTNKAGVGHQIAGLIAAAGINLRGLSATVIGRRFVSFLAFDSRADAAKAARLLSKPVKK